MLIVKVSPQLTVALNESFEELGAAQYQLARQYEVMAHELGQNEGEQDAMLARAENYALAGQLPEFQEQLYNYRLARRLTKSKYQPGQLDWACHVHSVNGQLVTDYSEDGLLAQIDQWSALGLTQKLIEETLADVKKNSRLS